MSWIKTIPQGEATGKLKIIYDRLSPSGKRIDNILTAHSLRPHTLEGHMQLYKNVLHHSGNSLPKWFLESVGVYVSLLNNCAYCVDHHFAGLQKLITADAATAIRTALEDDSPELYFKESQLYLLQYARKLTSSPGLIVKADIEILHHRGIDDGEILEINQVVAYFCYANRTVLGLGINTEGDELGLSPNNSQNADDWGHS